MPPLAIGWIQADWMNSLPFKTGSVTRLVCNLSLPYVPSPATALREWHRTLHPEGSLIITVVPPRHRLSRRSTGAISGRQTRTSSVPKLNRSFTTLPAYVKPFAIAFFIRSTKRGWPPCCGIAASRPFAFFPFMTARPWSPSSGNRIPLAPFDRPVYTSPLYNFAHPIHLQIHRPLHVDKDHALLCLPLSMSARPTEIGSAAAASSIELLDSVTRFSHEIGALTDLGALGERIIRELCRVSSTPHGALYLLDREHEHFRRAGTVGLTAESMLPRYPCSS